DASALTAGERPKMLRQNTFRQPEAGADARCLTFGDIAAQRGESLLELSVSLYRTIAFGVVDDFGHHCLLLFQISEQGVEASRRQHAVASEDVEITFLGILWEITDFAFTLDVAGVRFGFAGEDSHGGCLTRAVAADEADAITGLHAQR